MLLLNICSETIIPIAIGKFLAQLRAQAAACAIQQPSLSPSPQVPSLINSPGGPEADTVVPVGAVPQQGHQHYSFMPSSHQGIRLLVVLHSSSAADCDPAAAGFLALICCRFLLR